MICLILMLLAVGALLAAFGTAGFVVVWQQGPAAEDLRLTRAAASLGRRLSVAGLILFTLHHDATGAGLAALLIVAALAVATYLTKSTLRIIPPP